MPDLQPWGDIIGHYLKPGGFFYIAEGHPFMWTFDDKSTDLKLRYPYFSKEPIKDEEEGTYAEKAGEARTYYYLRMESYIQRDFQFVNLGRITN